MIKNPFQYLYSHVKRPWNIADLQTKGDQKLYDALNRIVDALNTNPPTVYSRTLLIKNATIGNDIADAIAAQNDGTFSQVVVVLRDTILSDLTINLNLNGNILIQCNIPFSTVPLIAIVYTNFNITTVKQNDVLTADIMNSDGSIDPGGIASFTLEWI